jgi:hypothetical protein
MVGYALVSGPRSSHLSCQKYIFFPSPSLHWVMLARIGMCFVIIFPKKEGFLEWCAYGEWCSSQSFQGRLWECKIL